MSETKVALELTEREQSLIRENEALKAEVKRLEDENERLKITAQMYYEHQRNLCFMD